MNVLGSLTTSVFTPTLREVYHTSTMLTLYVFLALCSHRDVKLTGLTSESRGNNLSNKLVLTELELPTSVLKKLCVGG